MFIAELKRQNPHTYKRLEKAIKAVKLHTPDGHPSKMTVEHKKNLAQARRGLRSIIEEFAQGPAAAKAATRSLQATIDFSRGGQWIKKMNYYIPFLNAAAEGSKIPIRALFTQRAGKTAAAAKIGAMLGATGGLTWYNTTFQEYWDVDPIDRHTSLIFMLPPTEKKQPLERMENGEWRMKPKFIRILPRLREWAILHGSIIKFTEELKRSDDVTQGQPWSEFFLNDVIPETSPISIAGRNFSARGIVAPFIPPIFKTPIEIIFNQNMHFNTPLVDKSLPEDDRLGYSSGTNPTYRLLSDKLNIPSVPFLGEDIEIGAADVMRHGIRTFTGTLGEELVTGLPDWIIDNYFLEYILDPEIIEPYKMISEMNDETEQQRALSELDPVIREKVLIELKRRKTRLPFFNKLSETIYASQGGYGTEREVFPEVASQFDVDRAAGEEFDQDMQIHVNRVQRELYEIS